MAIAATATLTLASRGFGGSTGRNGGDASGATTLNLLVPSYSDQTKSLWDDVIAGFEAGNSGIKVNLEVLSWDNLERVISTKVQGNDAPDI